MRYAVAVLLLCASALAQGVFPFPGGRSAGGGGTTYTYYCDGTSYSSNSCSVYAGQTSVPNYNTVAQGVMFTTGTVVSVQACGVYFTGVDGTNKNFKCGIFTYTSGSTISTTPVCSSAQGTLSATGWTEATFSSCTLSSSTNYVLLVVTNGAGSTGARQNDGGTQHGIYTTEFVYSSFPGPTGPDVIAVNAYYAQYIKAQ